MAWVFIALAILILIAIAYTHKTLVTNRFFQKMGVASPPATLFFGHLDHAMKHGFVKSQKFFYEMFKDQKVYGLHDLGTPALYVKDLDMVKDIFVKHANNFMNRRDALKFEEPFQDNMLTLKDDRWKRVRSTISPIFSSSQVKKMAEHIQKTAKQLVENLREKQEKNEEVELKDVCAYFTLDVIAGTGYGLDINSLRDPDNPFAVNARKALHMGPFQVFLSLLFPKFFKVFSVLGLHIFNRPALIYLTKIIDSVMLSRQGEGEAGKVNDFLDLLMNAETEEEEPVKGTLAVSELHGVALNFLFAGFDTVSSILAFTLFLLANHPKCLQKAQEEIDEKLSKTEYPDYDSALDLIYLDMCINESLRMFPVVSVLDRVCTEDITIQGIHIPKGLPVAVPVYCIHHDPEIWPDPDQFQPERFSAELKASRNHYAHIPFGHGPRNCLGMRLGLVELKMALASILKNFTPVPCSKTIYPITLVSTFFLEAKDGLWVKLEGRK